MDFDTLWTRFVAEHPEAQPLRMGELIEMRGLVGFLAWAVDRSVVSAKVGFAFLTCAEGWSCYEADELRWADQQLHALLEDMNLV